MDNSMIQIDSTSHVPIYRQIVDSVRSAIAAGTYPAGDMLPSVRAMAKKLIVNPNTVQRAYESLDHEGLATSRKGVGLFVTSNGVVAARASAKRAIRERFSDVIDSAVAAGLDGDQILKLFSQSAKTSKPTRGSKND